MLVRTAVIPAAGLGTRFLPATKAVPKELLPIIDTPALQLIIDEAVGAGIDHIVIVTNRNKPAIEAYFESSADVVAKL
ncbi:MAG TPA: sugar phosphate nucleotidyltransferase [Ilumatobacteraceae bacterium]|nr:sugar phosphate nucleotidyltransferase [Ilumatobacteraceae bacterium]